MTERGMNEVDFQNAAWIEDADGKQSPILGVCHLGRSANNEVVLRDPLVSRHHALIQTQGDDEYWVVDFGSRNGTYLNNQRISAPSRLHDGDSIRIGYCEYVFRQTSQVDQNHTLHGAAQQTVYDIRMADAWLLVADIVGSTKLIEELPQGEMPKMTGNWLGISREIIEESGGRINQFMGDGYFAYWKDQPGREADIESAMRSLRLQQYESNPAFRFVIHFSPVVIGGLAIGEEERISGSGVHFVFRMEKLASHLKLPCLLSAPAEARLKGLVSTTDAGMHTLPGFDEPTDFYAWSNSG
jgi:class 3 adenylate cyclase